MAYHTLLFLPQIMRPLARLPPNKKTYRPSIILSYLIAATFKGPYIYPIYGLEEIDHIDTVSDSILFLKNVLNETCWLALKLHTHLLMPFCPCPPPPLHCRHCTTETSLFGWGQFVYISLPTNYSSTNFKSMLSSVFQLK